MKGAIIDINYTNADGNHYPKHVAVYVGASGGKYSQYRLGTGFAVGGDFVKYTGHSLWNHWAKYDDWGVLTLNSPTNTSSHMGLNAVNSASDMVGRVYFTQGYPEDLNINKHTRWDEWDMYKASGRIIADKPQLSRFLDIVTTTIPIEPGQSGSPVYTNRGASGNCIEAIVEGDYPDPNASENYLILVNDWLVNHMKEKHLSQE